MKFEVEKRIKTPDGIMHDSRAAAEAHMRQFNIDLIAACDSAALAEAISYANRSDEIPADVARTRIALRDVYLAAFPRANTGKPRPKKEPESKAPNEPATEPPARTRRSGAKR